jgi:plastocyanin
MRALRRTALTLLAAGVLAGCTAAESTEDAVPAAGKDAAQANNYTSPAAAPEFTVDCPTGAVGDYEFVFTEFGYNITAAKPFRIAIDYGDGSPSYMDDDSNLAGIFEHEYRTPGQYTVQAIIKDANGMTAEARCKHYWMSGVSPLGDDQGSGYGGAVGNGGFQSGTGYAVVCADGWLSYSGGRQGACSHHGGIR